MRTTKATRKEIRRRGWSRLSNRLWKWIVGDKTADRILARWPRQDHRRLMAEIIASNDDWLISHYGQTEDGLRYLTHRLIWG